MTPPTTSQRVRTWLERFTNRSAIALMFIALPLTSACHKQTEAPKPAEPEQPASRYHAGKGLLLSGDTRKALGLSLAPAKVATIARTVTLTGRCLPALTERTDTADSCLHLLAPPDVAITNGLTAVAYAAGDSSPGLTGRVAQVSRELNAVLNGTEALVVLDQPIPKEGRSANYEIVIHYPDRETSVHVPREAVVSAALGTFVYVVNGGFLKRRPVKIGATAEDESQVLEGLRENEIVVRHGARALWILELAEVGGMTNVELLLSGGNHD